MSDTKKSKDLYKATRKGENFSKGKDITKAAAIKRADSKYKNN